MQALAFCFQVFAQPKYDARCILQCSSYAQGQDTRLVVLVTLLHRLGNLAGDEK